MGWKRHQKDFKCVDFLIGSAELNENGTLAFSSHFGLDGVPGDVVLVATGRDSERVRLLWGIHEAWYPEIDEDD